MVSSNFNPSYIRKRDDVLSLIPADARIVLDVGCSSGVLGQSIKNSLGAEIIGIEMNADMAKVAAEKIDKVFIGDAEEVISSGQLQQYSFDCIVFADILEHLNDPWNTLAKSVDYLKPTGRIIASLPNIRRAETIYNLIFRGIWPYRDQGIHDKTHLRFFTKNNIIHLFNGAGLSIIRILPKYWLWEGSHRINRFSESFAVPLIKDFLVFQYLVVAQKEIR